jgi:putative Mn2+ efflux pump MntP
MSVLTILLIAIGLAMDCFAVSICKGMASAVSKPQPIKPILMAILFDTFQGGMPLIGYFAGTIFADFFHRFAPWIALVLLGFLGGKMILESLKPDTCDSHSADFKLLLLLSLAVATSIDALATGVIFIPYPERLWLGVGIIAVVSFLFAIVGYLIGLFAGTKFKFNVGLLGGIILIIIGVKICLEGLCF